MVWTLGLRNNISSAWMIARQVDTLLTLVEKGLRPEWPEH